jgi:hypothetical protein
VVLLASVMFLVCLLLLLPPPPPPAVIILSLADVFTAVYVAVYDDVDVPDVTCITSCLLFLESLTLPAFLLDTGFATPAEYLITDAASVVATVSVYDVSFVFPAAFYDVLASIFYVHFCSFWCCWRTFCCWHT